MNKRIAQLLLSVLMILFLASFSWGWLTKGHPTHQEIVTQGVDLKNKVHKGDLDGDLWDVVD